MLIKRKEESGNTDMQVALWKWWLSRVKYDENVRLFSYTTTRLKFESARVVS